MTRLHSRRELVEAALDGEGVCLDCGEVQDFQEARLRLGLCEACGEQRVMPGEDAQALLALLEGLDEG
jgi:hypothetical protein